MLFYQNLFHRRDKYTDVLTVAQEICLDIPKLAAGFACEKVRNNEVYRVDLKSKYRKLYQHYQPVSGQ